VSSQLIAEEVGELKKPPKTLSLNDALLTIKGSNLSLVRFDYDALADLDEAESNNYFPDPTLFIAAQNLPTDTFKFNQEPMTQLRFGIRQAIPAGDTLSIKHDTLSMKSEMKYTMQDRQWLRLKRSAEQAWFEAFYWQKTILILDEDVVFLKQVLDVTQSLYEVGARDQSDILGVELEMIQLEEKRIDAQQNFLEFRSQINILAQENINPWDLDMSFNSFYFQEESIDKLKVKLEIHPDIMHKSHAIHISTQNIKLAEQSYAARWSLEASYGLRSGENSDSSDRPDFFSAGVSLQIPLFSKAGQDSKVRSAHKRRLSAESARAAALKNMVFEYMNVHQKYLKSLEQSKLYELKILPTLYQQKNSVLIAYQSGNFDFNRTLRVFLKEQNARLKHQRILVNQQKMLSKLHYWIPSQARTISSIPSKVGAVQ
jgi:hypothetical protein